MSWVTERSNIQRPSLEAATPLISRIDATLELWIHMETTHTDSNEHWSKPVCNIPTLGNMLTLELTDSRGYWIQGRSPILYANTFPFHSVVVNWGLVPGNTQQELVTFKPDDLDHIDLDRIFLKKTKSSRSLKSQIRITNAKYHSPRYIRCL